jgi:hypothetical protein
LRKEREEGERAANGEETHGCYGIRKPRAVIHFRTALRHPVQEARKRT